jgi:hypothetical protein
MATNVVADYEVQVKGPIFTGAIRGQMKRAIRDIEDDIGDALVEEIRSIDDSTFREPTGHATSMVTKERKGSTMTVDRQGLVYGPWLEDGGSRSELFPGYHAFRDATREVDDKVPDIVDNAIARYLIQ